MSTMSRCFERRFGHVDKGHGTGAGTSQGSISKVIGNNVLNIIVLTFICDNLENSYFGFMYLLFQNMVVKVLNILRA